MDDPRDIERAIQRAVVEVWVMRQAQGSPLLPKKIGNPTADFEARLATGAKFNKDDRSLNFMDQTLQEDMMVSLGLSLADEIEAEKEEQSLDQVSEDMIEGTPLGKRASRPAPVEVSDPEPVAEEAIVEDPATGEPTVEEVITVGEPEEQVEGVMEEPLPDADTSYRVVKFGEPEIKFAVVTLSPAIFRLPYELTTLPGPQTRNANHRHPHP